MLVGVDGGVDLEREASQGQLCPPTRSKAPNTPPTNHALPSQGPRASFAQAQFDFSAQDSSQLSFRRGDIIEVLEHLDPHWWRGRLGGRIGFFPRSYVQSVQL